MVYQAEPREVAPGVTETSKRSPNYGRAARSAADVVSGAPKVNALKVSISGVKVVRGRLERSRGLDAAWPIPPASP